MYKQASGKSTLRGARRSCFEKLAGFFGGFDGGGEHGIPGCNFRERITTKLLSLKRDVMVSVQQNCHVS
jgi:hypothetical protein